MKVPELVRPMRQVPDQVPILGRETAQERKHDRGGGANQGAKCVAGGGRH